MQQGPPPRTWECAGSAVLFIILALEVETSYLPLSMNHNYENVFVQFVKCIFTICQMYLSKLQNVFVQIAKYICSTWWQLVTCCSPAYTVSSESQLAPIYHAPPQAHIFDPLNMLAQQFESLAH